MPLFLGIQDGFNLFCNVLIEITNTVLTFQDHEDYSGVFYKHSLDSIFHSLGQYTGDPPSHEGYISIKMCGA